MIILRAISWLGIAALMVCVLAELVVFSPFLLLYNWRRDRDTVRTKII